MADYRVCPDTTVTRRIQVIPYPKLNLGQDNFRCPNAGALVLEDCLNAGNPAAAMRWTDGTTNASMIASKPANYFATVTINGCSTTDNITIFKDCYLDIPNTFTPNGDGDSTFSKPGSPTDADGMAVLMVAASRWAFIFTRLA